MPREKREEARRRREERRIERQRELVRTERELHSAWIDATRKRADEGHPREWPDDIAMSDEIRELVDKKWQQYGISLP